MSTRKRPVDLYEILEVTSTADDATLKSAYRRLARTYHPDVTGGDRAKTERFKEIVSAYAILSDPDKRAAYDREQAMGARRPLGMGTTGHDGRYNSIFGPMFDELVDRVQTEGLKSENLDSIISDTLKTAKDVQAGFSERMKAATKSPGSFMEALETILDQALGVPPTKPGKKKR